VVKVKALKWGVAHHLSLAKENFPVLYLNIEKKLIGLYHRLLLEPHDYYPEGTSRKGD
jgi:hypothetical protein